MSSHFSSLALTISQTGSFGGLLPGYKAMSVKRAVAALSHDGDESEGGRPAKRVRGKKPVRESIDDGPVGGGADSDARPTKRTKGKAPVLVADPASERSALGGDAASRGICLRCSKRVHLEAAYPSPNGVVPVGYLCDWAALRKCSYCAAGHHGCEAVGLSTCFFELC